ncbi:MAG TPA: hypothetical protein VHU82_15705 [Vicinamibacterales bacterium]|nr:hypothetical protein [Vicinamibacterales bacterium]
MLGDRSGALHLMFAWRSGTAGHAIWEVLLAFAYGAIGFYLLAHPLLGLASLTPALAIYLFIEGVLEFVLSGISRLMLSLAVRRIVA